MMVNIMVSNDYLVLHDCRTKDWVDLQCFLASHGQVWKVVPGDTTTRILTGKKSVVDLARKWLWRRLSDRIRVHLDRMGRGCE